MMYKVYYRIELTMKQEQRNQNGRLLSGMTRNSSPVYLVSYSGHTGGSPGACTSLQPSRAHGQETSTVSRQYQNVPHRAPNLESYGPSSSQPMNYAHPSNQSYNLVDAEIPEERVISGVEGSDGEFNRSRTNTFQTETWYCANPGCLYTGPYIASLYTHCIQCGMQRTRDSPREIIVTPSSLRPR
jgi:hypothetical protein